VVANWIVADSVQVQVRILRNEFVTILHRIAVSAENWDRKDPLRAMMDIAQASS